MKKAKNKALLTAARKVAKGSIEEKVVKALTEAVEVVVKPSKGVEKAIKKESKKVAKKIAAMLNIDVQTLLSNEQEQEAATPVKVAKTTKPVKKTDTAKPTAAK